MSDHKPLPALPTLSVDARRHRAELIKHFLSETRDAGIEQRLEGWVVVFEDVLDELGRCVARDRWLKTFRVSREKRCEERRVREAGAAEEVMNDGEDEEEELRPKVAGKGKGTVNGITKAVEAQHEDKPVVVETTVKELPEPPSLLPSAVKAKQLLLCVAPLGARVSFQATETEAGTAAAANIGCTFIPGTYTIQDTGFPTILYGHKGLYGDGHTPQVVGGTFNFNGVNPPSQFHHLFDVLRLSVYLQLSLILEQHFLVDSHVSLTFPRPPLPSPSPSVPTRPTTDGTPSKEKKRTSFIPSGIFSFLSRHGLSRSTTVSPVVGHHSTATHSPLPAVAEHDTLNARSSLEVGIDRLRKISLLGERKSSPKKTEPPIVGSSKPFSETLAQIENNKSLFSTSPGVSFPSPKLLVDVARAEGRSESFRLRGDQKTGLGSLLGWNSKENSGAGMIGLAGFLRHQELSFLYAQFTPCEKPSSVEQVEGRTPSDLTESSLSSPPSSSSPSEPSSSSSVSSAASFVQVSRPSAFAMCGNPVWKVNRYYFKGEERGDCVLGEAILDFVWSAPLPCKRPGCCAKRGQHQRRLIHGGIRVTVDVEEHEERQEEDEEKVQDGEGIDIWTWQSCRVCEAKTEREEMTDGTFLLSYAKFIELLVYSPLLAILKPVLCEHTTPPPQPWLDPPLSRFNIIRHFSIKSHTVSFTCSILEDLFEIRVPRLQIIRGTAVRDPMAVQPDNAEGEDDKKVLRREIKRWWEGVADHMDKLESVLASEEERIRLKALPRLPSSDDDFDQLETTPKLSMLRLEDSISGLPAPPSTPVRSPSDASLHFDSALSSPVAIPVPPPTPLESALDRGSADRLSSLRHTFQRMERSLYAQLGRTPATSMNDARRSFVATARGAEKRLRAWQKKHMSPVAAAQVPEGLEVEEPEWWEKKCHAVPGSNTMVHEDDWGSLISYTLSCPEYQHELVSMSLSRVASTSPSLATTSEETSNRSTNSSSLFSAAMGYRLFTPQSRALPDPDVDDVAWSEQEPFSSVAVRQGHPRDTANIIEGVLRRNSKPYSDSGDGNVGSGRGGGSAASQVSLPLRYGNLASQRTGGNPPPPPPSAWAKPDVQVTRDEADGRLVVSAAMEQAEKILEQAAYGRGESVTVSRPDSRASGGVASSPPSSPSPSSSVIESVENRSQREYAPSESSSSAASFVSAESDVTIGKESVGTIKSFRFVSPPPLPPKDDQSFAKLKWVEPEPKTPVAPITIAVPAPAPAPVHAPSSPSSPSSFTSTLTSGFGSVMRFMLRDPDQPRVISPSPKHALLFSEPASGADDKPHVKHEWTVGKRLKFSCTVFYAKQFDVLRRRCGIDDVFVKSLSCSANWAAQGGKSRSAFWKTADDRFIIKTLVDAWNVADLQVLLEIAPSYFRYLETTANRATVLAKVLGFYTVEIRNLESGTVQSKADLLVMENLFYERKVSKTFDLKGIHGRKVKPATGSKVSSDLQRPKTLFDGEWIEGQQKAMLLVHSYSKHVLQTGLRNDADFLTKSNIMDYSLLVGVNEEQKELACGLVDTIGSYTFAKTLEYKAKHGLNTGKDITVMPPVEYEERFLNALDGYFVACPDKWSKPPDDSKITQDVDQLGNVL